MLKHILCFFFVALGVTFVTPKVLAIEEDSSASEWVQYICTEKNLNSDNVVYMYRDAVDEFNGDSYTQVCVFDVSSVDYVNFTCDTPSGSPVSDTHYAYKLYNNNCPFYINFYYWNDLSIGSYSSNISQSSDDTWFSNVSDRDSNYNYIYSNPVTWVCLFDTSHITSNFLFVEFESYSSPNSSVIGNSDEDLLNGLYNITFVPKSCSISNSSTDLMINNIYECTLVSVRSDNGYNMLSIQCPALAQNQDIVYYGDFTFHLRKVDTSITGGSLSFAVDVPTLQLDEPDFYIPASSYFKVTLLNPAPDGTLINNAVSFTVNDFSFLNSSGSVCRYSSRSMLAFDYTGNDLYSLITFTGAVGSNMYSAGSFVYNFSYSDIVSNGSSLPPEDIDKIKEEGRKHSDDTKRNTAFVPKYNGFPDTSSKFTTPNLTNYDFTSLADIFNSLFNDYVINMMMISVSVGIVGYILFGRGD